MELTGGTADTTGDRDLAASGRQDSAKELLATGQAPPPAQ
jgi:hypothetical protein